MFGLYFVLHCLRPCFLPGSFTPASHRSAYASSQCRIFSYSQLFGCQGAGGAAQYLSPQVLEHEKGKNMQVSEVFLKNFVLRKNPSTK